MRALMTATVPSMIGQFNMNNIKLLLELGYEVDVATNFEDTAVWNEEKVNSLKKQLQELNVNCYTIDFVRSPKLLNKHISSYKQMKTLMNERKYDLIHTHTPISSLITRLAYWKSDIYKTCKMIYTAHGFHFFKGNSSIKNFIFRTIESIGAKYTDSLITINKEDYSAAKLFSLKKNGEVEYVPGVGINLNKIRAIKGNKNELIEKLNLPIDSILLLSVGELNDNKNHKIIVESLPHLSKNVHYLICGQGNLDGYLVKLSKELGVENQLHLLGFRNDVLEIMSSSDIFIFPSKREGLSVALMEAMACGLPCVVSDIRGNRDLINNEKIGLLSDCNDVNDWILKINKILDNDFNNKKLDYYNNNLIESQKYDIEVISKKMINIYRKHTKERI